jgi:hypothetical protein
MTTKDVDTRNAIDTQNVDEPPKKNHIKKNKKRNVIKTMIMINQVKIMTVLGQKRDARRMIESMIAPLMTVTVKRGILGSMIRTGIRGGEVLVKIGTIVDVKGTESLINFF